jgi:hypothetical protein
MVVAGARVRLPIAAWKKALAKTSLVGMDTFNTLLILQLVERLCALARTVVITKHRVPTFFVEKTW